MVRPSALSELLPHLSMTHGSDCHCYVAHVHLNSSIGTLYSKERMDEEEECNQ